MAAKKTAKKTAAPAEKAAKKTATPVAKADKPAPAVKKTVKKAAKKAAAPAKAEATAAPAKTPPTPDAIARAAYLNYRRRIEKGLPGDSHGDWLEAERQLGVIS